MYELEENEGLIKYTDHVLERKGRHNIRFRVYEVIAPDVKDKFIVAPTQALDMNRPKKEFSVRDNDQAKAINKFIPLVRHIENSEEMFEEMKNDNKDLEEA